MATWTLLTPAWLVACDVLPDRDAYPARSLAGGFGGKMKNVLGCMWRSCFAGYSHNQPMGTCVDLPIVTLSTTPRSRYSGNDTYRTLYKAPLLYLQPSSNRQLSRLDLHTYTDHSHRRTTYHYHISHTRSTCPRHLSSRLTSVPTIRSWTTPRARSPHHRPLHSTHKECPRRTSRWTTRRSRSRSRFRSPRARSTHHCHSTHRRRWSGRTRRRAHLPHHPFRARGASLRCTGRTATGPGLPSWRTYCRRRRSQRGAESSRRLISRTQPASMGPHSPFPRMRRVSPARVACHLFGRTSDPVPTLGRGRPCDFSLHPPPRCTPSSASSIHSHASVIFFFVFPPFFSEFYTVFRIILHGH